MNGRLADLIRSDRMVHLRASGGIFLVLAVFDIVDKPGQP